MAVQQASKHLNLFTPQLIQDTRNFATLSHQGKGDTLYVNGQPMSYPTLMPTLPLNYAAVYEAKTSVNTDSGLTYNIPSESRKRSREQSSISQFYGVALNNNNFHVSQKNNNNCVVSQLPSFLGDDFLPQIQQHQLEIDAIISQHTKKIRLELVERQKQQERILAAAIGENVMIKLKEKEEQIQRMSKLNLALQERVKSLFLENQLWRDLAQSNEATANSLRSNLEQVLAHVGAPEDRVEEEAESCCGSSDHGVEGEAAIDSKEERDNRCKSCGERESCVLLLPCRHLCLCNVCGSGSHLLQSCPVCNASMNATLHVNMSS